MAGGLLGIGSSALLAYQRALNTVGHNVANVNTPGYSRQRVELSARVPEGLAGGTFGAGVDVDGVQRIYNQFLTGEIRTHTTNHKELNTLAELSASLDNLLADDNAGLNPALNAFFDTVQGAADDPTSLAARQVMVSEAETLTARFNDLHSWIQSTRSGLNSQLSSSTQQINQLAGAIAAVNKQIVAAEAGASGLTPNDLLDQRDQLVLELSSKVSVSTTVQDDGSMNVFMGSGQVLVLGANHNTLGVTESTRDPGHMEITISAGGASTVPVTDLITGGELGGILKFRSEVLDPAQNSLGRIAVELGSFMNAQHHRGITLDGLQGQDIFTVATPQVIADPANSGSISVGFDDVAQLSADDYDLRFSGSAWTLTGLTNGQVIPLSGSGTPADPLVADGLSIVVGAGAAAGDNYTLRPTRNAAGKISVALSDPRDLALAAPVSSTALVGNTGTGTISMGAVTDIDNPAFQSTPGQLSPEVLIRFTSPGSYTVLDKATLATLDTGSFDPATGEDIFPTENLALDYGYRVRISGNPAAGDEFSVDYSAGAGDNRNALSLAGMQSDRLMANGTASFNDAYGQVVADVGTRTRQAQVNSTAVQRILEQSEAARAAASGVNLDEEAADLLRFQQAYQAAAQVIAVADQMFETLIGAVRR
ncbi:MAG: flagellar hook-associated protein FlgK [Gammaproteobacteria bacterium]